MKSATIHDIIQWLRGNNQKTVKIKSLRQPGAGHCGWATFPHVPRPEVGLKFEFSIETIVLQDVTLKVATHYSGTCGVIGYAEGKPVVEGQRVPDVSTALPLWYDRHGEFRMDGHQVTSLKYLWLLPDGSAKGVAV